MNDTLHTKSVQQVLGRAAEELRDIGASFSRVGARSGGHNAFNSARRAESLVGMTGVEEKTKIISLSIAQENFLKSLVQNDSVETWQIRRYLDSFQGSDRASKTGDVSLATQAREVFGDHADCFEKEILPLLASNRACSPELLKRVARDLSGFVQTGKLDDLARLNLASTLNQFSSFAP